MSSMESDSDNSSEEKVNITKDKGKKKKEKESEKQSKKESKKDNSSSESDEEKPSPYFVINSSAYVSSDHETDESDKDSDNDSDDEKFEDEDFKKPSFYIDMGYRGTVDSKSFLKEGPLPESLKKKKSRVIQPLIDKLLEEGYADDKKPHEDLAKKHLSLSIGLNRPRSLSSGKNKALAKEFLCNIESKGLRLERFAFFWDFRWRKRKGTTPERKQDKPVSFKKMRSFYKQFKKYNKSKAREFRRKQENQKGRGRAVPYRSLRETSKNHTTTKAVVQTVKKKNTEVDIYLSFVDSDTLQFKKSKSLGIYQAYTDSYLKEDKAPDVMTSGYEFDAKESGNPMLAVASVLDRRVRVATARYIPRGVYYPEPNFCVRVLKEKETVSESFEENDSKVKNYSTPKESIILLEHIVEQRNDPKFIFLSDHPIITKIPERAKKNKKETLLKFEAKKVENSNKFLGVEEKDLANITTNMAQSHAASRSWAINLLWAFKLEESVKINSVSVKNKIHLRNMAISLLSRLFSSFNPIDIVKNSNDTTSYSSKLFVVLNGYKSFIENKTVAPKVRKKEQKRFKKQWKFIDKFDSRDKIAQCLGGFFVGVESKLIESTAKAAGLAVKETLLDFFLFSQEEKSKDKVKSSDLAQALPANSFSSSALSKTETTKKTLQKKFTKAKKKSEPKKKK